MARIARVVVPGYPHHVTQRGSRRQLTFFRDQDYLLYLNIMSDACRRYGVEIWAYCLMPNHIHLVAVPSEKESLAKAIGSAHRKYAMIINAREGWTGHLWQERFSSSAMDESYLLATVRYVEKNPVRARLVRCPEEYSWSSARAHLEGKDDRLVTVSPMLSRIQSWEEYIVADTVELEKDIQKSIKTGRPLGRSEFVAGLEKMLGRSLRARRAGRKRK